MMIYLLVHVKYPEMRKTPRAVRLSMLRFEKVIVVSEAVQGGT